MNCEKCNRNIYMTGAQHCFICDPDLDAIIEGTATRKTPDLCRSCFKIHVEEHQMALTAQLQDLLAQAKYVVMTPEQQEMQRQSFAFGNAKIENPDITRKMISYAARELARER